MTDNQVDRAEVSLGFSHDMAFFSAAAQSKSCTIGTNSNNCGASGHKPGTTRTRPQNISTVVLVVHGETAQYWNACSQPALAVGLPKGLLTDEKPASDSDTTKL